MEKILDEATSTVESHGEIFEEMVHHLNAFRSDSGIDWPLLPAICALVKSEADLQRVIVKRHAVEENLSRLHLDLRQYASDTLSHTEIPVLGEATTMISVEFYVMRTIWHLRKNSIVFSHPWMILHLDGTVDQGGPLRGWLSDLLAYISDTQNRILAPLSETDMINRKFAWMVDPFVGYFCGAIIGKAIQQGVSSKFQKCLALMHH
jgi:hypothetical protein